MDVESLQVNLGAYLVPEREQEEMRKEAEAAAAPQVVLTPEVRARLLRRQRRRVLPPWAIRTAILAVVPRWMVCVAAPARAHVRGAQVVATYLDRVLQLRVEDLGEWPQVRPPRAHAHAP